MCAACFKDIPAFEMVMRARSNVYHLECFACQQCNHRYVVLGSLWAVRLNRRYASSFDKWWRLRWSEVPPSGIPLGECVADNWRKKVTKTEWWCTRVRKQRSAIPLPAVQSTATGGRSPGRVSNLPRLVIPATLGTRSWLNVPTRFRGFARTNSF